jgi:hypothetical protein
MEKDELICKICGFRPKNYNGFGSHIKQYHLIETKNYYDSYIRKDNEGKCKECENESSFYNLRRGYRDHCSKSCSKRRQPNSKGWVISKMSGYVPWNKGKKMTEEYKKNWLKGVKDTEWVNGISEKTKNKIRSIFTEKLKKMNKSFHPPYNRKACEYFNLMMEESDFFIQHAENFGEFYIKELGYWVDGYDRENNIVYEWDEKSHFINKEIIEKDRKRQEKIEKLLKCKFVRIKQWD